MNVIAPHAQTAVPAAAKEALDTAKLEPKIAILILP